MTWFTDFVARGICPQHSVIAGLDPAIHEAAPRAGRYRRLHSWCRFMDARVKPGHDAEYAAAYASPKRSQETAP